MPKKPSLNRQKYFKIRQFIDTFAPEFKAYSSIFYAMISKINIFQRFSNFTVVLFVLLLTLSVKLSASEPDETAPQHEVAQMEAGLDTEAHAGNHLSAEEKVDITAIALEHVADAHSWHFWGEGHDAVALPLPIILYSSTKGLQMFSSAKFEHGHASYNGYSLAEEKIMSEDPSETIFSSARE